MGKFSPVVLWIQERPAKVQGVSGFPSLSANSGQTLVTENARSRFFDSASLRSE
jgi:hypothetical protein